MIKFTIADACLENADVVGIYLKLADGREGYVPITSSENGTHTMRINWEPELHPTSENNETDWKLVKERITIEIDYG